MVGYRQQTIRRAAIIAEIASLGLTQAQASNLLNVDHSLFHWYRKNFGVQFPVQDETPFRRAVRKGYEENVPIEELARKLGSTVGSIKVTASKIGVSAGIDPYRNKRGYLVPEHLKSDYRELREYGLTVEECGWNLGIVPRPKPHRRYETYAGSHVLSRY